MPRRKSLSPPPADPTTLSRATRESEFEEAIELYGDPRIKLLHIADRAEREEDLATAARCLAEVSQYVAPKLRAMEVQATVQSTQVVFNIDLTADEDDQVIDVSSDE